MTVPFYCPMCNATEATLIQDAIFASPNVPVLECDECHTQWRINLYEVEIDGV
jgi:hypothetical protein